MKPKLNRPIIFCLLLILASVGLADPPAYRLRDKQMEYHGPGRESEIVQSADEIRIAWFGPGDPDHPEGGDLWRAAQLAIDHANDSGGYQGKKFRLLPVWSETPWDEGARRLAEVVYRDRAVAIVGGIDGASTHVAEQIAAKARLPVIAPASTDKSINLAGVPWMFSCLPGDHLLAPALADSIPDLEARPRIVLLSSTEHDSHLFAVELLAAFRDRKTGMIQQFDLDPQVTDLGELTLQLLKAEPASVIGIANTHLSARLIISLRGSGFAGHIHAGPAAARRRFVEIAKSAAEGVVVPLPSESADCLSNESQSLAAQFHKRYGYPPDFATAQTLDAVAMLVAAIGRAGTNRARIADSLRQLSPFEGAAGTIRWDPVGANTRTAQLGVYRQGRLVALE